MPAIAPEVSPLRILETINGFHRTAVMKTAIELNLFTAIGEGAQTAEALASKLHADARGLRILCDALAVLEFLHKSGNQYSLAPEAAAFLDQRSPAYLGSISAFLNSGHITTAFARFTDAVRKGGTALTEDDILAPESEAWVTFARSMAPLMMPAAQGIAEIVAPQPAPMRVLDVAAGHGVFGITIARRNPKAEVTALDWPNVLQVAEENAKRFGVQDRWKKNPGSAFTNDFGTGYDLVLFTNFLHHFDRKDMVALNRRALAALKPGGRLAILEFVPNPDRISPPVPALFSCIMLASTPSGDAYTYAEHESACREAGFSAVERRAVPPGVEDLILATR